MTKGTGLWAFFAGLGVAALTQRDAAKPDEEVQRLMDRCQALERRVSELESRNISVDLGQVDSYEKSLQVILGKRVDEWNRRSVYMPAGIVVLATYIANQREKLDRVMTDHPDSKVAAAADATKSQYSWASNLIGDIPNLLPAHGWQAGGLLVAGLMFFTCQYIAVKWTERILNLSPGRPTEVKKWLTPVRVIGLVLIVIVIGLALVGIWQDSR